MKSILSSINALHKPALIALALLAAQPAAALTLISQSIVAGQPVTFSIPIPIPAYLTTIAASDCDLCYLEIYDGTYAQIFSGDGQSAFAFGYDVVSATFTYSIPGDYIASAAGAITHNTYQCYLGDCQSMPNGNYYGFDLTWPVHVAAAVPEPATWAMMLIGFAGLGFAFRRSRRRVSFP